MMNLKNEIDNDKDNNKSLLSILDYKTENYVITNDNFNKMILILYRIISNIPFIIMGETGCGKTLLITKLNQLINNGELLLEKININPDITEQIIYEEMKRINEKYNNTKEEIWVFFDNINTCQSFELINEIFINRTFFGEKLNENIRIMGACNPFRKTKNEFNNCLAYNVHPLPQSLLYYVFSFGFMNNEDEKDYIYDMVEKLFNKNKEEELHKFTADSIFECHKFLRSIYDYSVVSLKDVNRFIKCVEFFKKYYKLKEDIIQTEKLYKIKSIICSIYLCYYFRLDIKNRSRFDIALRKSLLKLVNYEENNNLKDKWEYSELLEEIKYRDLKINLVSCQVRYFSDIIKIEEDFLMDKIEINDDIYKNDLLKENIFVLFISIVMKIPLRLFGKPNSGKTLSINLIIKTMKGKYSKNKFFQKFPAVIPTYFEGSLNINKKDIKNAFQIAERKFKFYNEKQYIKNDELPFSLVIFDNMDMPNELIFESKNINYICISNNLSGRFNFSQMNKGLVLQAKTFDDRIEVVIDTCKYIANTIGKHISKNAIFDILPRAFIKYKNILHLIRDLTVCKNLILESIENIDFKKKDFSEIKNMKKFKEIKKSKNFKLIDIYFHGYRDLFNLIKGISKELSNPDNMYINEQDKLYVIENYIERNLGGIDYEFDIDLSLTFDDIDNEINLIKKILKEFLNKKTGKIIISSIVLFKKIYNVICEELNYNEYIIKQHNLLKYDLSRCIMNNIEDHNSRYLLLKINPSLSQLIYEYIRMNYPDKNIICYEQNPYINDTNNEHIINQIKQDAKNENIIIIQNINSIKSFLYQFCEMNYIIKDEQIYYRIINNNFLEEFIPVNNKFKIIIFVDEKSLNSIDKSFLNRFEKINLTFDKLMNEEINLLTKKILDEVNLEYFIDKNDKKNYNLKNLLINYGKEEISGLIYSIQTKNKDKKIHDEEIKMKIYYKLTKMLCLDIINCLPNNHILKKIYENEKKI